MLCSHCPINDSSGYLHVTVYLAVMLQASGFLKEGLEKQEFPPSPVTFSKINQKSFPWNLRVNITY